MSQRESDVNGTTTNRLRTRQVSSQHKSPTLSTPRRFPSPNVRSRSPSASTLHVPTRAFSAERRRPSTPVTAGSKLSESLWPPTMQNPNDSFQADNRDKIVSLKGNNSVGRLDNSLLVDSLNRHHRSDVTDKMKQNISLTRPRTVAIAPSVKKVSMVGTSSKPSERANIAPSIRRLSTDETSNNTFKKVRSPSSIKRLSMNETSTKPLTMITVAPSIRRLSLDGTRSKPLETVNNAPSTRRLSVDGTSSKNLEFIIAPSARRPSMDKHLELITNAPSVRRLSIDGTSSKTTETDTVESSVRRLSMDSIRSKPLDRVTIAPSMRRLSMDGTSINHLESVTITPSTRRLSLDSTRSESLNTITIAPSVRKLSVDGTSIKPLETDTISPSISRLSGDGSSNNPFDTVTIGSSVSRLSIDGTSNKPFQTVTSAPPVKRLSTEGLSSKPLPMITVVPSVRRLSLDGTSDKPVQKSASDLLMLISENGTQRPSSSRGISPSRAKGVSPFSRGTSPARVRQASPSKSFHADVKKWKRDTSDVEDSHQLRLLYNRHLQWRFANARTDDLLRSQKRKAETRLYNLWRLIIGLLDSVTETMSDLQQMKLTLKLYSILDSQVSILNDQWTSMERDHTNAITWAIQDLQDTTVCLPVTGGAKGDIKTVEAAVSSAIDVMSSMGASLCSILSRVEAMNRWASELADVVALEGAMLVECESLLCSTEALQVKEYSLRIHLLQMIQACKNG